MTAPLAPLLGPSDELSPRERDVLLGIVAGWTNRQIGRSVWISEDTVKTHAKTLYRKLGAANRADVVAVAFRWGLVT